MILQELQARLGRLHKENAAWRLLKADNAPFILAFITDLFTERNEIDFSAARVALDTELETWRKTGLWETEIDANGYLREWIKSGWLRELNNQLSKTDACEIALRFCQNLERRETNTSASHLRIVQEAVRDLLIAINPDRKQGIKLLEAQKTALQREIDDLQAGVAPLLSPQEQRERVREVYQLAAVLTLDFRRLEDEMRVLDQQSRRQMIGEQASRSEVLQDLLEKENRLNRSEAGAAFEGFYQLLRDENRSTEFRVQLRDLLKQPAAENLSAEERRYLEQLMRELNRESERVLTVRRRTSEGLRAFVETGAHLENYAVTRLLTQLEKLALCFEPAGVMAQDETRLRLPSGKVKIHSPASLRLREARDSLNLENIQVHVNASQPSEMMLESLQSLDILSIASVLRSLLQQHGTMTLAGLSRYVPLEAGLEELVAWLRIARAVCAPELPYQETVLLNDRNGLLLRASIPCYQLSAALFPDCLDDLIV